MNNWHMALSIALLLTPLCIEAKTPRNKQVVAEFKRLEPCPANGNRYGPCPGWQIDHRIPLKCDGPDRPDNMQWLTVEDHKRKTKREARLCRS